MGELDLRHDTETRRYEAWRDDERVSSIAYHETGWIMIISSTVTAPRHRGFGYAGVLTRFALDDVRARGLRVRPDCPYTAEWIDRHPDYSDLRV